MSFNWPWGGELFKSGDAFRQAMIGLLFAGIHNGTGHTVDGLIVDRANFDENGILHAGATCYQMCAAGVAEFAGAGVSKSGRVNCAGSPDV